MTTLQAIRRWALQATPVFICGVERSGTSILQVSLARHPALFPVKDVYETFIFLKPGSALEFPPPTMTLAYLQGQDQAFRDFCANLGQGQPLSQADQVRAFFHFCAHQLYGGRQPLEKTPGHVRQLSRMLELFPRARVLVCTREPVSIVASYRKRLAKERSLGRPASEWGWLDRSAEQLVAHFEAITAHLRQAQRRWPQQVFVAPYDWITASPETALREICEFAGLTFSADILTPPAVAGRKVDELLSKPITRRESEDDRFVDAATAQMIRTRTAGLNQLWQRPGLAATEAAE